LHSQKNSSEPRDNGGGVRIWRNRMSGHGTEQGARARSSTGRTHTPRLPSRRERCGLPISAVFGLRYRYHFRRGGGPPRSKGPDSAAP
jgi:hypothetical protein